MLVGDPAWKVIAQDDDLLVTGGADAVWLLEDVPAGAADVIARYWSDGPPSTDDLPAGIRPIVEHLAGLGALRPAQWDAPVVAVTVEFVGSPVDGFTTALDAAGVDIGGGAEADLVVVVRTNEPLSALVDVAADLDSRRARGVLCDLAFHHTIGLGPHVFPRDTSCFACLAGRVGTRWGDPSPPPAPAAGHDAALAARLVARWLESRAGAGSDPLVNATIALDLVSLATRREPLWRFPSCPVCADWVPDGMVVAL